MTDEPLDLPKDNPHRSATPVRQLNATDLGISVPSTREDNETDIWDELRDAIGSISADCTKVAVATTDATITTSFDIQKGSSRPIHAIELGVWKAYSEEQSPVTNVLVQPADNGYTPCGRCLQTVLDYSNEALVRVMDSSEGQYEEFSLDQPSILNMVGGLSEGGGSQGTDIDATEPGDDESESMPIPETPPFIDVEVDDDEVIEFVRLNAPVYHLKYQSHDQTFCGTNLAHRETVSSTERPTLLDPCSRCHGETSQKTVEEQRIELRGQLAGRVAPVKAIEEDAATFNEAEMTALLKQLPVTTPTGGNDTTALRTRISQTVVDVHDDQENPTKFTRAEMEALLAALDGKGTISDEPHLLVHTSEGRVARIALSNLSLQHRAGKGEMALSLDADEVPTTILDISPRDQLYVFTDHGQVHQLEAHKVPSVVRSGNPTPLSDIINLNGDESLQAAFTCSDLNDHEYVILGSRDGYIKRTATKEFENIHRGGIRAVELEGDDVLQEACLMDGDEDFMMNTREGRVIRFDGTEIRPMGRTARGVKGIVLDDGDAVVAVNVVDPEVVTEVFTVTAEGYGKRTALNEYRTQSRNGRGLVDISTGDRNGPVVGVGAISSEKEEFVTISEAGRTIHVTIDEVTVQGRNTKGVEIMGLNEDDLLAGLTIFDG